MKRVTVHKSHFANKDEKSNRPQNSARGTRLQTALQVLQVLPALRSVSVSVAIGAGPGRQAAAAGPALGGDLEKAGNWLERTQ
jgi:hypothetical protein